jgi:hypothetical protein
MRIAENVGADLRPPGLNAKVLVPIVYGEISAARRARINNADQGVGAGSSEPRLLHRAAPGDQCAAAAFPGPPVSWTRGTRSSTFGSVGNWVWGSF